MFRAVDPTDNKTPLASLHSNRNARDDKGRAYKLLCQAKYLYDRDRDQFKKEVSVKDTKAAKDTNLYWLLHSRDNNGLTFVHRMAAQKSFPEYFDKLLQFCERFGNEENIGEYPLTCNHCRSRDGFLKLAECTFEAVRRGSLEALHSIAREDRNYLVDARDNLGCTLLHLAALGNSSMTRLLLCEWNVNPNAVDFEGRTPLLYALVADDLESTKLLVKAGACVDVCGKSGKLLIDLESRGSKSVELMNDLNEILERSWRAELSVTALNATVQTLSRKFDLDPSVVVTVRDRCKDSMVHHAVRNNEPELLRALLKHGAVYNAYNASDERPVDLADGEIEELLRSVENIFNHLNISYWEEEKDIFDMEIMTRFCKSGGYTLLHTALKAAKTEEAKWLMARGADVNVTNNFGSSALKLARELSLIEM